MMFFFTTFTHEPRFYKPVAAYVGFVLSVAWIYVIANEVVDVVSMIGVMAGVSHELLGLTILAWANSIGDMVADFSVARQGFPRMAISAAIGGPLFNLMIGFGVSFFIAKAQGKHVTTHIQHQHGVDT
uniref:Sodium/calcium exchanger membrane region domain-containing protein n=1 Tax=Acrobeloides nanus TaxID=290746 RepID=A0A914CW45_9BILA